MTKDINKIKILAHVLEDDDAIVMLLEDQLKMNEVDYKIYTTDGEFLEAFHDKVHIAVIDFKPSNATALNGTQITKVIIDKNPDCRVMIITGLNDSMFNCQNVIDFFHSGGFRWLSKDDLFFKNKFTDFVQQAIHFTKTELYRKEVVEKTAGLVVRDRKMGRIENRI
jgi:FixJ family two-component response regulator